MLPNRNTASSSLPKQLGGTLAWYTNEHLDNPVLVAGTACGALIASATMETKTMNMPYTVSPTSQQASVLVFLF